MTAATCLSCGKPSSNDLCLDCEQSPLGAFVTRGYKSETRPQADAAGLAGLLDALEEFIRGYVVMSAAQADAVTLWAAHTHALDAFETTPYLAISSPTKRCGKSRLLDVLDLVVARAWRTITPSEAVLYRKIDQVAPTLLLDETDAIFLNRNGDTEPLRALLNAGNRRGTAVPRCVGPTQTLVDFHVFCAKALAGIGNLPDTIADRSVRIRMERKRLDEQAQRFRHREASEQALALRQALESWAQDAIPALAEARPEIPDALDDRAEEAWEPLIAIADQAGGDWPERARRSALELAAPDGRDDETLGVLLLSDIRDVFAEQEADRLSSAGLAELLCSLEESPWGDLRGKPLDARALARRLRPFSVTPRTVRFDDETTAKGYHLDDLEKAFSRYLTVPDRHTVTTAQPSEKPPVLVRHKVTDENGRKPASLSQCDDVTDKSASEPSQRPLTAAERVAAKAERDRLTRERIGDDRLKLTEADRALFADDEAGAA